MTSQTEQHLTEALRDLVADQPFEPDRAAIEQRGVRLRKRARIFRGAVGAGVVVVVAAVTVTTLATARTGPAATHEAAAATTTAKAAPSNPGGQLVRLAADVMATPAKQPGDATLVLGEQSYSDGEHIPRADLFGDNGTYYFAHTRSGLPAQVREHNVQGDGVFAREVAAAKYAATGNLSTARVRMADAPLDPGTKAHHDTDSAYLDNWIWGGVYDTVEVAAGDPQVRAGILRLLSTMDEVTVTHTTTNGRATLTVTAGGAIFGGGEQETLILDAATGEPIEFQGGQQGHAPDAIITYQISRVTLADVAAGRF